MKYCTHCGHALDAGGFCASCGRPTASTGGARVRLVDHGTDTAERPAVVDAQSGPEVPSNARFPLYADEVRPVVVPPPAPSNDGLSLLEPAPTTPSRVSGPLFAPEVGPADTERHDELRPPPWAWLAAVVSALALVVAGLWWWLGDSDRPDRAGATDPEAGRPSSTATATDGSASPDEPGEGAAPGDGTSGRVREVAGSATAVVPAVAPPNADVSGRPVSYGPEHLFDGDPATTWRMPGDGTGSLIVIRLGEPTEVREVGLVNGYAKTAVDRAGRTVDWYPRNRRVLSVRWSFDDGSVVDQRLDSRAVLQRIDVGSELTSTIRLRLVEVSPPQAGPLGRDYTAISEISVHGTTG